MHWIWWVLGAAASAVGLMAAVGAMLPLRHHATRKARFRASPEALYAVLAGPPDWRTGVKAFGVLPDAGGRERWWEQDSYGHKITYELDEARPPERLRIRLAQPGLAFGGSWMFDIAPAPDGGAELRISADGEIHNVIFRFLARFVFGYHAGIDTCLNDLGAKFGQAFKLEA